ncbi:MAG: type VI secretion system contractile sheath large subunit [Labilithrix sp.]|nr:type VI secretion system contractile sheath large subunit [Labilithrix sp.]MCW5811446.1 type VI secretion system contractile sheath large subunit [Labilithrix sp.]
MNVLVLAPLRASADHAIDGAWKGPLRFEHATFDQTMSHHAPGVVVDLPNPAGGKPVRVEHRFSSLASFHPESIRAENGYVRSLALEAPQAPSAGSSLLDDILDGMGSREAKEENRADAAASALASHPEVRAIERAWRGLHFLTASANEDVVITAFPAAADDVDAVLAELANAAQLDLVVVDHIIDGSPRDLERLEGWARRAEAISTPVICGGVPALLGHDDLESLGRSQRRLRASDAPRASALRATAAQDAMRWIAIALNGSRAASAPELVAAACVASFVRTGWPCAITGPIAGTGPLEATVTEDVATEAAAAGVILLASTDGGAMIAEANVLHREASRGGTSPAASLSLVDQLFLVRLGQTVTQLAASIPAGSDPAAAREAALVVLTELFAQGNGKKPTIDVAIAGRMLEVTVRARGFEEVRLDEATLGARLT